MTQSFVFTRRLLVTFGVLVSADQSFSASIRRVESAAGLPRVRGPWSATELAGSDLALEMNR